MMRCAVGLSEYEFAASLAFVYFCFLLFLSAGVQGWRCSILDLGTRPALGLTFEQIRRSMRWDCMNVYM